MSTDQQVQQRRSALRMAVERELQEMQDCIHAISSNLVQGAEGGHLSHIYVSEKTYRIKRAAEDIEDMVEREADDS